MRVLERAGLAGRRDASGGGRPAAPRSVGFTAAPLVHYDKKACNYLALIKLACALLWYRRLWRLSF